MGFTDSATVAEQGHGIGFHQRLDALGPFGVFAQNQAQACQVGDGYFPQPSVQFIHVALKGVKIAVEAFESALQPGRQTLPEFLGGFFSLA